MDKGNIIVISGPSGCGKGTVIGELLKKDSSFQLSVSMTTRLPRPGEVDGRDYYFVSKEVFEQRIADGDLLEYTNYNGNFYGTPKKELSTRQAAGINIILDIEVEGADNIRKANLENVVTIFLAPPSFEELRRRLIGRGTEPIEVIENRLARAKIELAEQNQYDYVIINDVLEKAVDDIYKLVK